MRAHSDPHPPMAVEVALGGDRVCPAFPELAVPACLRGPHHGLMLTFIAWRGVKVLCRCRCGRFVEVRPAEFAKTMVAECGWCRASAVLTYLPPAARAWVEVGLSGLCGNDLRRLGGPVA